MRVNRGKIVILLLMPFILFAQHRWEIKESKLELFVGEATLLNYTCYFDDEAYGTSIDMQIPKDHADYILEPYSESEKVVDDKRQKLFQYVLFPKKSGEVDVLFNAKLRKTSRAQVENAVIGRDNVEYYQFETTQDRLPVIHLHVKESPTRLVGDFSLHVKLDKESLTSFEPLHVSVVIKGSGNLNEFIPFDINIEGVDIFKEKPQNSYQLTKEGFKGKITQKFALVSEHDFTLPPFTLEFFNPKTEKREKLVFKERLLHVKEAFKKEQLLDKVEEDGGIFSISLLYYFLTLLSGVALGWYAHIYFLKFKTKERDKNLIKAKDAKTLLTHLALKGGYDSLIERAEKESWSLKKIEKELF
jgi:hypothetical protein